MMKTAALLALTLTLLAAPAVISAQPSKAAERAQVNSLEQSLEGEAGAVHPMHEIYAALKQTVTQLHQQSTPERVARYRELVAKLTAAYRAHIASEDSILMEIGRRVLTQEELSAIHNEMRSRR